MLVVGASAELDAGTAGDTDIETSTCVVLVVGARAAGAVVLVVGASTVLYARTTGDADIEASASVMFAVSVDGGSGLAVVGAKRRQAVLLFHVSRSSIEALHVVRNLPAEEQTGQLRGQRPERGTERPRK